MFSSKRLGQPVLEKFAPTQMEKWNEGLVAVLFGRRIEPGTNDVMASRAQQYRQLARDFHFMARSLPHGENRMTLLKMAEECERLADQQERDEGREDELRVGHRRTATKSRERGNRERLP